MEYDDPTSEPARVRAAQAGDSAALEELLQAYLPLVHAIASRALDHHADADDVAQETMVRAVAHLSDLRDPDSFRPWIVAIAVRQIRERSRRARRRGPEVSLDSLLEHPVAEHDVAEQVAMDVDGAAQRELVDRAVQWLEPEERQVLALWQLELEGSISRDDVAGGLGIARTHAAVRIHRLRSRLEETRQIVTALAAVPGCPGLRRVTRSWDGEPTSVWRKRLHRHVRGCDVCSAASRSSIPVDRLLAGALLAPLPAGILLDPTHLTHLGHLTSSAPAAAPAGFFQQVLAAGLAKPVAVLGTAAAGSALAVTATIWPVTNWGPGIPDPPSRAAADPLPSVTLPDARPAAPRPPATRSPTETRTPTATTTAANPSTVIRYGRILYVSPDGSDAGPGSLGRPLRTVAKALKVVRAGQTITLREGVYRQTKPLLATTSGTARQPIVLTGYRGEKATLDGAGLAPSTTLLELRVAGWEVRGIEVRNAPGFGVACRSCSRNTFERLDVHDNGLSGMVLTGSGTSGNRILDSDFHHNHDDRTLGENADGLEITTGTGEGNVVRGCRAFHNADDGLSTWNFRSSVLIDSVWSFGNGHNRWHVPGAWAGNGVGFKLGGADGVRPAVPHVVLNSAAWDNRNMGFSANRNEGALRLVRNTSFANHSHGFWVTGAGASVARNVSVGDGAGVDLGPAVDVQANSWQGSRPNTTQFASTNPSVAEGPRAADGGLPVSDFLIPTRTHVGASMRLQPFPDS